MFYYQQNKFYSLNLTNLLIIFSRTISVEGPRVNGTVCLVLWLVDQPDITACIQCSLPRRRGLKNSTAATAVSSWLFVG